MNILSDEMNSLKAYQLYNQKSLEEHLEDYRMYLPYRVIGFGFFTLLIISFGILDLIQSDLNLESIKGALSVVFFTLCNYWIFFNKVNPEIEKEKDDLESLEINLKRLDEILSKNQRIMLFLRPYKTIQMVENKINREKGLKITRYTRSQKRKFILKIEPTMESRILNTLIYNYQIWELNNSEITNTSGAIPIHAVEVWENTFYKVVKYVDYFIILVEDRISSGINTELNYIKDNNLENCTIVILFNVDQELPFEPRWKIKLQGSTPSRFTFPDDFLQEIKYLRINK